MHCLQWVTTLGKKNSWMLLDPSVEGGSLILVGVDVRGVQRKYLHLGLL